MTLRALIFDVDGTLAETEEIHRAAFNAAFAETGLPWLWTPELYGRLLKITGGRERITAYAREVAAGDIDVAALHARKTDLYNAEIAGGGVCLRPGVAPLIHAARAQGLALAIATTTSRANVLSLIAATLGADALGWFASLRTGEDVARKKPDPEVYRLALADLGIAPAECLAFEDSANGLQAARGAGIAAVITPSSYTQGEDFCGAAHLLPDLAGFRLGVMPHCA